MVVQVKIKLYVVYQFAQNGVNGNRGPNAVLPVATDKKLGMIITVLFKNDFILIENFSAFLFLLNSYYKKVI